jgi:hypothetical protein
VPFISRITFGSPTFFEPSESKERFLQRLRDDMCALRPR